MKIGYNVLLAIEVSPNLGNAMPWGAYRCNPVAIRAELKQAEGRGDLSKFGKALLRELNLQLDGAV